jgi:bleomycin hydrolase
MINEAIRKHRSSKTALCWLVAFLALLICALGVRWLSTTRVASKVPSKRLTHYRFTTIYDNPALPVTMQQGGTCWCFSATSLVESEITRLTGQRIKLSEAFFIRHAYFHKARNYLLRQGNSFFDEGADSHDVFLAIDRHGMLPSTVYPSVVSADVRAKLKPIQLELLEQIKPSLSLERKHPSVWQSKFNEILDRHLGVIPYPFEYEGRMTTPVEFRDAFKICAMDYMLISSYSHSPFYKPFVLEMTGNYANFEAMNLPIDEWESNIVHAIESGFTASFDCDVSEPFFLGNEGVAILPDRDIGNKEVLENYIPEQVVTQASRQEDYESSRSTDDHQLHAVGIAVDENGTRYFKLKNSWGAKSGRDGFVYMSTAYLRSKVLSVLLHRDGLLAETRKRLLLDELSE